MISSDNTSPHEPWPLLTLEFSHVPSPLIQDSTILTIVNHLSPHPSHPNLITECILVKQCKRWLASQDVFKLQPHGRTQGIPKCPNRGYIKVKGWGFGDNDQEFYLHRLLCYMYRGPPPSPHHVVGHLCHHKLCLCPWHLNWILQSENVQMGYDHAHHRDYAHPM